ncbi:MAG TPA: cytochrome c [Xanthobacteraceae bacterium]|nr:cytochrome c [Xanthobacteraceae bacterium]
MFRRLAYACLVLTAAPAFAQSPIERGAYLVNTVMTCHNCHTPMTQNGPDFSRALSGGPQVFDEPPFTVRGANITPDQETGIGKWTDAQIKQALRKGVRPDGSKLAPIMPTGFYEILTDRDLDAIVAYLRSVKPVKHQVAPPIYKAAFERQVFPGGEKPMAEGDMSNTVKRGFYLATAAHCMECHTPQVKGHSDFAKSLGKGGTEFKGPWGVSVARNITSHKEKGLGAWSDDEIKTAITKGVRRDGTKLKPPMGYPYYARMTPDDLTAIVAWLRTVPPQE